MQREMLDRRSYGCKCERRSRGVEVGTARVSGEGGMDPDEYRDNVRNDTETLVLPECPVQKQTTRGSSTMYILKGRGRRGMDKEQSIG